MSDPHAAQGLFRPGQNCCAVERADRVAFLVDGADYFAAFMAAAERAERSIVVLAWDFDSRTPLAFGDDHRPRTTVGEFLNDLARRRRRLRIHVLDWDYPMIFGTDREFAPLYGFGWKRHRRVHFRFDDSHPLAGSHHQKIVVIDDRLAFVGGLDLTTRRWDTPDHRPDDPRRTAFGKPYPPFHDLMIAVDGEAAAKIAAIARERWRIATGRRLRAARTYSDPWPRALHPDLTDARGRDRLHRPRRERPLGRADRPAALPRHDRPRAPLHLHREPVLHLPDDRRRARRTAGRARTVRRSSS